MLALEHEVLGHRRAGVGGDVLQRGGAGGAGDDHGRVVHRAVSSSDLDHAGDGRFLLADGDVEALHAGVLLVDDRVDGDGRLAGLAVADDQLALAAADRRHGVDGLDAGLQRLAHRLPLGDAGGDEFDRPALGGGDRALAVERIAERIEHAAEHGIADRHATAACPCSDLVPFVDLEVVAENDDADGVLFEVERQADDAAGELDHLAGHDARQAVDAGDAVADFQHRADFADVDLRSRSARFPSG